ncbi:type II toxin-antitoxin system VapC family toxin [Candidatus Gottesmanbacteria bacterium]|nr:type II toxin-antitoxin system VapC family toxin [Candidatus Gottesmanbacteria bacterium]
MDADSRFPPRILIDASLVLAFLLPDEKLIPELVKVLFSFTQERLEFFAPEILPFEVLNGLRAAILTKRVKEKEAHTLAEKFLNFGVKEIRVEKKQMFDFSLKYNLSTYDAAYLTCSFQENIPLYTCDRSFYQKVKHSKQVYLF